MPRCSGNSCVMCQCLMPLWPAACSRRTINLYMIWYDMIWYDISETDANYENLYFTINGSTTIQSRLTYLLSQWPFHDKVKLNKRTRKHPKTANLPQGWPSNASTGNTCNILISFVFARCYCHHSRNFWRYLFRVSRSRTCQTLSDCLSTQGLPSSKYLQIICR